MATSASRLSIAGHAVSRPDFELWCRFTSWANVAGRLGPREQEELEEQWLRLYHDIVFHDAAVRRKQSRRIVALITQNASLADSSLEGKLAGRVLNQWCVAKSSRERRSRKMGARRNTKRVQDVSEDRDEDLFQPTASTPSTPEPRTPEYSTPDDASMPATPPGNTHDNNIEQLEPRSHFYQVQVSLLKERAAAAEERLEIERSINTSLRAKNTELESQLHHSTSTLRQLQQEKYDAEHEVSVLSWKRFT